MSTTLHRPAEPAAPAPGTLDATGLSTRFGVAYATCQLLTLVAFSIFVLPHAGSPSDPALERGHRVDDAADIYRAGNYVFMVSGMLLLGFLGAVGTRLRRVDASGALASVVERAARVMGHLTTCNGAGGQAAAPVRTALVTIVQAPTEDAS